MQKFSGEHFFPKEPLQITVCRVIEKLYFFNGLYKDVLVCIVTLKNAGLGKWSSVDECDLTVFI